MSPVRRTALALAGTALGALAFAAGTGAAAPSHAGDPPLSAARLQVKAFEYGFTLSRPFVVNGPLILEYDNNGEDTHNLRLRRERPPGRPKAGPLRVSAVASRARVTQSFRLHPGTYNLYCSLPGHAGLGMTATLVVHKRPK